MAAALRLLSTDWQVRRDETDSVVSVTSAGSPTTQVFEEVLRVVGQVVEYADRADDSHSCSGVSVKTTPRSSQALGLGDFGLSLGLGIFAGSSAAAGQKEASDAAACTGAASWSAGPCATSEEIGNVLRRLADNVQALDLALTAPSQASEFDSQTVTTVAAREPLAVTSLVASQQDLPDPAAATAAADPGSSSEVVAALSRLATGLSDSPSSAAEPSPAAVVEALARGKLEVGSPVSPTAALNQLVHSFEAQNGGAADGGSTTLDSLVRAHEEAATAASTGEVAPFAAPPVVPDVHTEAPEAPQPVSAGAACAATVEGADGSPRELETGTEAPVLPEMVAEPSPGQEAPAPPADAADRCLQAPEDVVPGSLSEPALEVLVRALQEEVAALRESEQARVEEMRALQVAETSRVEGSLRELEVRLGEQERRFEERASAQERASADAADRAARASRAAAEVAQDALSASAQVSRLAVEVADLRQSLEAADAATARESRAAAEVAQDALSAQVSQLAAEVADLRQSLEERASAQAADAATARDSRAAAEVAQDALSAQVSRMAAQVADLQQSMEVAHRTLAEQVRTEEQASLVARLGDLEGNVASGHAALTEELRAMEVAHQTLSEQVENVQLLSIRSNVGMEQQAGFLDRLVNLEVQLSREQAGLTEELPAMQALLEEQVGITERLAAWQLNSANVQHAAAEKLDKLEAAINTAASNREEAKERHADIREFVDCSLAKLEMQVQEEVESLRADIHRMSEELRADLWREAVGALNGRQHQAHPAAPADWHVELHRLSSQVASDRAVMEGRLGGMEARLCDLRRDVYERLAAEAAERTGGYDVIAGQVQRSALREELDKRLAALRQELSSALVAPAAGGNGSGQRWASSSSPGRPGAGLGAADSCDPVGEVMEQSLAGLRGFKNRLQEDEHRPMEEVISHLVAGVLKMAQFLGVASEDVCEKLSWRDACCDLPRMMDHAWLRCRLPKRASLLKVVRQKADAEQVSRQQQQLDTLLATLAVAGGSLCQTPASFGAPAPAGMPRPPGSPRMWSHVGCGSPSPASRPLSAATTAWSPDDDAAPTRPPSAPPSRRRPGPAVYSAMPRWGAAAANAAELVQA